MRQTLTGGAYQARSVVASAQRCVNLYVEPLPQEQGEPMPAAHYPTPGSRILWSSGTGPVRAIHECANGAIIMVESHIVYAIEPGSWVPTLLGNITAGLTTPVSIADDGFKAVIVDGSANGWTVGLDFMTYQPISSPLFYGGDRVDYVDTYFVFNQPNTARWYMSLPIDPFNPYDLLFSSVSIPSGLFATKVAYSDRIQTLIVAKRDVWLLGAKTTEVWADTGDTDVPFVAQSEVIIDHGCVAKYSAATYDNAVFWLGANRAGQGIVLMGSLYSAKRISTYAIEAEIAKYATAAEERISDAIGFCYSLAGHAFYVLAFPTIDKTWVYDITTGHWHQWMWLDTNGDEHRHRANCYALVAGVPVVGDWQNGHVLALDMTVYTDVNGGPIKRVRSFPHMVADADRLFFRQFIADFETGTSPNPGVMPGPANTISLRWSNDSGHTWGNPVTQSIGETGEYLTSLQWQRLGMSRSRVFELSWSVPMPTVLQGCFVDATRGDEAPPPSAQQEQAA
jgi:hypothetical protein